MAKIDELAAQVEALTAVLKAHGITPSVQREGAPRPDYIAHGSLEHAAFLGLVEVKEGDKTITLVTYTSPRTGRTFRLEDEMGAIRYYPGIDPEKAALLVLQQKINELEIAPSVPKDAPPAFRPAAVYPS
jgi:hypothetical protein